ncbi:MAG: putative transposase [Saprospiraceae bacterium]|jgi:putative transposase
MKRSKLTEIQIIKAIKANKAGSSFDELLREVGINRGAFYSWRKQYAGMEVSQL